MNFKFKLSGSLKVKLHKYLTKKNFVMIFKVLFRGLEFIRLLINLVKDFGLF